MPDRPAETSASRCPICGDDNACGLVAGKATCWCFETRIPGAVLDRVPAEARDRSCICQACAAAAVSPAAAPDGATDR